MNRLTITACCAGVLFTVGCASHPERVAASDSTVALSAVSDRIEITAHGETAPTAFRLGAGDALGQSIFTNYVAYVRAQRLDGAHYATVDVNE